MNGNKKQLGVCILAAGFSSRMGRFKPILPLGDVTVIERLFAEINAAAEALRSTEAPAAMPAEKAVPGAGLMPAAEITQAEITQIVVVTGHNREALRPFLERAACSTGKSGTILPPIGTGRHSEVSPKAATSAVPVKEAFNPRFGEGMFTSIQTGLAALPPTLDGFFLVPVDCPLIDRQVLLTLAEHFAADRFTVPCYRGKKGHPLLIPAAFRTDILSYSGDGGLKAITDRDPLRMQRVETGREVVVMDMDTPADYQRLQAYLAQGCRPEALAELAAGKRFILIRHGQIRQHKEKIFLGQTDVPLSDTGREQARQAGAELARLQPQTDRIYTSDLLRACQSAEIIAGIFTGSGLRQTAKPLETKVRNGFALCPETDLREMNLGPWDGKFIREIREQFPEEYARRGAELMTWKLGHKGENFYDLQYRVISAVCRLVREDPAPDMVIVAHSGVLRAIETNLRGGGIDDPWRSIPNGGLRVVRVLPQTAGWRFLSNNLNTSP